MAHTVSPVTRRTWPVGVLGALVGLLVGALLAWYAVVLGVQAVTVGLPSAAASRFVPADGHREQASYRQDGAVSKAMVENARLEGGNLTFAMSSQAFVYLAEPDEGLAAASWWREAVVSGDVTQPPRYRIRSLDTAGIWLRVQDWEDRGLSFENLLELPTEVAAGRTWSSSGRALGKPTDRQLSYRNTSSAALPVDAGRRDQGCLQVTSTTELTSTLGSQRLSETNLWCPGVGVLENRGEFGSDYAVLPATGQLGAVPVENLQPAGPDTRELAGWVVRDKPLINGDPSFGAADAQLAAGLTPQVTVDGVVVFPLVGGSDLTALIPQTTGSLWWHWWARPGGDVVSMAVAGTLVVVTTTHRELLVYTAAGRFRWGARLDDVSVVSPLVLGANRLAVGTVSGSVSVFDLSSGSRLWTAQLDHGVHSPLAANDDLLVAADAGATTTVWDSASGRRLWSAEVGSGFTTTLAADDSRVLVAANGLVSAYQARTGDQVWTHRVGLGLGAVTRLGSQLQVVNGQDGEAWSAATGRTLWSLPDALPAQQPGASCTTGVWSELGLYLRDDHLLAVGPDGVVRQDWPLASAAAAHRSVYCAGNRIWVVSNDPAQQLRVETIGRP